MATTPYDQLDGYIWLDGEFTPWSEAQSHVITQGLHYGGAVFEGERAYNGKIFKLMEHSERLVDSAKIIDLEMPYSAQEIADITQETFEKTGMESAYIRPIAWRGSEQMGISIKGAKTHLAIACWHWGNYFTSEDWDKGITLKTSKWRRFDPRTAPVQSKASGLYVVSAMVKNEAESAGFNDALMLDLDGNVAESSGANIFMIKDGAIKTPPPKCFLNGITRQTVMDLAREKGIPLSEETITPEEILNADEIFVTGTAAEVTAVSRIDDTQFTVGPIARSLRDAYYELVNG